MATDWREMALGDVIMLQRGHDLPIQDRKPGEIPVVTSAGISGTHSEPKAKAPGVVMGRYGTLGEIYYLREDYWPHNTTLYVKDFKGNDPHYIYYLLKTLDFTAHNDKTSVPGLNRNHLHTIRVKFTFDVAEQRAIAHILGSLDDKIELNRRMNATLEESARALFKSWFVDFDPVRAKMEGRQPEGIDSETAALFPDRLVESALGLIPEGWRVGTIGSLGTIVTGKTPPTQNKNLFDGEILFIRIPDMHNHVFTLETAITLSQAGSAYQKNYLLPAFSVCVSCIATPGIVSLTVVPSHTNQQINSIICNNEASPFYVYFVASGLHDEIVARGSGGSATLNLNKSEFSKLLISFPMKPALLAFHDIVKPIFYKILALQYESISLAVTRDALLPKLLSGEVRVGPLDVGEYNYD